MDITPEEALGCERQPDRLRLMITQDRWVDFELVDDPENDRLVLGAARIRSSVVCGASCGPATANLPRT